MKYNKLIITLFLITLESASKPSRMPATRVGPFPPGLLLSPLKLTQFSYPSANAALWPTTPQTCLQSWPIGDAADADDWVTRTSCKREVGQMFSPEPHPARQLRTRLLLSQARESAYFSSQPIVTNITFLVYAFLCMSAANVPLSRL